jgi:hypothetical protein
MARLQQTFAPSFISHIAWISRWLQDEAMRGTSAMDEEEQGNIIVILGREKEIIHIISKKNIFIFFQCAGTNKKTNYIFKEIN